MMWAVQFWNGILCEWEFCECNNNEGCDVLAIFPSEKDANENLPSWQASHSKVVYRVCKVTIKENE